MAENARHSLVEQCLRIIIALFVVAVVMAAYPQTSDPTTPFKQLLTAWFAGVLGLGWLFAVVALGFPVRRPRISLELLLCLLGFMLFSTLAVSDYKMYSLIELSIFVPLFILYLVSSQVFYRIEHLHFLIQWVCIGVAIGSIYAFMQYLGADPFPWADKDSDVYTNLPAMYGNPNFAAHTLILAIILAGYMVSIGHRGYLAVIALFAAHLYFTEQRAGLVALAAAALMLGVAYLFSLSRKKNAAPRVVVAILVTAMLCITGAAGLMLVNKARTGHPFPLDLSLLIRYQSYASASNMILDSPLLGHGPGVYKIAYAEYWTPFEQEWFAQENRMNAHVHNDLMEMAIDAGLPAAGLYMTILLMGLCYGLLIAYTAEGATRRRLGFALAAFFMAFAVDGLFGFNVRVPVSAAFFFLMLGALDGIWGSATLPVVLPKMRAIGVAVLLSLIVLPSIYLQTRVYRSEYQLLQALQSMNEGKLVAAREAFHKGESLAPWNWIFGLKLGQLAKMEGKHLESVDHLERSLASNPFYIMTHLAAAQAHLLLAQQQMDAMPSMSLGTGSESNATSQLNVVSPLDMLEEGRAHANAIVDLCPAFPQAASTLGRISSMSAIILMKAEEDVSPEAIKKVWEDAEAQYQRAIEYGAKNQADLYRLLARARYSLGKVPMAEDALARAAQIDPLDSLTWRLFFDISLDAGHFDRMRDTLLGMINRMQGNAESNAIPLAHANKWLAQTYMAGYQDFESADNAWREALRFQPLDAGLWSQVGEYAISTNRSQSLENFIRESCLRLENDASSTPLDHIAALNTLVNQGDAALNEATRILLAMYRSHPQNSPLRPDQAYGWAATYCYYRFSSATLPSQEMCDSILNLGIIFAGLKDYTISDTLFEDGSLCFSLQQRAVASLYQADTYLYRDRAQDAVNLLQEAIAWDPENLDVRWALARAMLQNKDIGGAKAIYEGLLAEEGLEENSKARLQAEYDKVQAL